MVEVDMTRFEELVADALDGIPADLAEQMDNVVVLVEDLGDSPDLLGLYEGVPLTERTPMGYGGMVMPDRITIYRLPILHVCRSKPTSSRRSGSP
jgi:predicted Zn-dependent protease with MMP-like domain